MTTAQALSARRSRGSVTWDPCIITLLILVCVSVAAEDSQDRSLGLAGSVPRARRVGSSGSQGRSLGSLDRLSPGRVAPESTQPRGFIDNIGHLPSGVRLDWWNDWFVG